MNSSQVVAVNEELIDSTILEFTNYIEKIRMIFTRLDDEIAATSTFYKAESGDKLRSEYALFSENYKIVLANLSSYVDDLKAVKVNHVAVAEELSKEVVRHSTDLEGSIERYHE